MSEKIVVRKDLNEIVNYIGFKVNKFGKAYNVVKLFNGVEIEFVDKNGVYDLFQSYLALDKDFIKTKELVEELRTNEEGESIGTYICVKYTLKDGSIHRLFSKNFNADKSINNYYQLYKNTQKAEQPKK